MRCLSLGVAVYCLVATAWAVPQPTEDSGRIGLLVGRVLSREHFRQQPLDDTISKRFLDLYLDALDYNHLMFLQSDIDEFQKYATTLDDETLRGSVTPGFEIFARYLQRVEQRVALVQELLKEKYTFDSDDRMLKDRSAAPWPANEVEARQLWRQRVKFELLQERLAKKKPAEAVETVIHRYKSRLRTVHEEDTDSVLQIYLTALAHAYDPHSEYMPPDELDNFAISMKLSLKGIGAVLSSEDGYAKVLAVVPGGPADLDKRLKMNDRIVGVAQGNGPMVDVVDMKLTKVVKFIRGEKGTEVRLLVIPAQGGDDSVRTEIRLKRDEIKLSESEAKGRVIERQGADGKKHRLGYIEIPAFYADMQRGDGKSLTRDMRRLLDKLVPMGIEGLVLDLRKNGGGSLAEVVSLTGLFVKTGPVVQVKDASGEVKVLSDDDPYAIENLPLVVLVSHISASASEIFAAALQDYGRAVIVGDHSTFGKGTVQRFEDINRFLPPSADGKPVGGALKFTVQKFYRISGGSTQYRGVVPDIQWPSTLDYMKINEASLKYPLPYDEVPPASYRSVGRVEALLPELKLRSNHRLTKDPEFGYVMEDIVRLRAQLEKKTVQLNEALRAAEQKEGQARQEKRAEERKHRGRKVERVTEVLLDGAAGQTAGGAALTKQVMDEASANLKGETEEEKKLLEEPRVDPEYDEGLNILTDLIELWPKAGR